MIPRSTTANADTYAEHFPGSCVARAQGARSGLRYDLNTVMAALNARQELLS
jgi:hypothetical protein